MYIEREAVINKRRRMSEYDEAGWCVTCQAVSVEDIGNIPSADVVEVVHGEWKVKPNTGGFEVCMKCSVCGFQFDNWKHIFKYCPVCGAKMDGERSDNDG